MSPTFFRIPSADVLSNFVRAQFERFYGTELLRWEWLALLCCVAICLNPWVLRSRWLKLGGRWFHRYAQGRTRAVITCALFPVVIRLALLPAFPITPPSVHDEFSLLLMADTFRSGHLTMPTHPLWQHFETIHVIQKPTYGSMYPPGFGIFLALGQFLGNPWIGVVLTIGLMSAALCWMLQAWLPPAWALGGALLGILQLGIGSYWMNSFVGGAPVPAMAGALLLGALPRFLKRPSWSSPALFAVAVVFMVNTRPFEGTILSVLALGLGVRWFFKEKVVRPRLQWRYFIPAALILTSGAAFTGYYSWRVTGSVLRTAYVENRDTYGWPENLAFLPPLKLAYRHKILANMEELELSRRSRYSTFGRMLDSWSARIAILWEFYIGPALTAGFLFLPWTLRNRRLRALFFIAVFMLCLNWLQLMAYPQHLSGLTAIFYLLSTEGLRQLYVFLKKKRIQAERAIVATVLCVATCAFLNLGMERFHIRPGTFWEWPHWRFFADRAYEASKLEQMPGKHVAIVRYADKHSAHEEWVYNRAEIDKSKVVWANSMGFEKDLELLRYYPDRQAWLIEPDVDPRAIVPYTRKTFDSE